MKPVVSWQVQAGDGDTVADVLRALGRLAGRVFVNGRRASEADAIEPGDVVELWPAREPPAERVAILAQRDGVLLASKPAGLPTETTRLGDDSVVSELVRLLNGGKVHAATRLDTMVSGVVVCTLGQDAARRVNGWRDGGQLASTYLAIAGGSPEADAGAWSWPLGKVRDRGGRHRAATEAPDQRPALTRWRVIDRAPAHTMLELRPTTGRMHQLRAHAALAHLPLCGDRTYGGDTLLHDQDGAVHSVDRVALHRLSVELPHVAATLPLPPDMVGWWAACTSHRD